MKKTIIILTLLLGTGYLAAQQRVPAYRGEIERIQPNGDTIHVYLRGDEHRHWTMTTDGWQVSENKKGYICYAVKRCNGTIAASRKVAHDEAARTKKENNYLKRKGIKKEK